MIYYYNVSNTIVITLFYIQIPLGFILKKEKKYDEMDEVNTDLQSLSIYQVSTSQECGIHAGIIKDHCHTIVMGIIPL